MLHQQEQYLHPLCIGDVEQKDLCHSRALPLCILSIRLPGKKRTKILTQKILAFFSRMCIILIAFTRGALAQLVARNVRNVEVRGSNPLCSTTNKNTATWRCFYLYLMKGIRTGAVVNEAPAGLQSRTLTERVERESESPMLHHK